MKTINKINCHCKFLFFQKIEINNNMHNIINKNLIKYTGNIGLKGFCLVSRAISSFQINKKTTCLSLIFSSNKYFSEGKIIKEDNVPQEQVAQLSMEERENNNKNKYKINSNLSSLQDIAKENHTIEKTENDIKRKNIYKSRNKNSSKNNFHFINQ